MVRKKKSLQEEKQEAIQDQRQAKQLAEFHHLIEQIESKKDIYYRPDLAFLRQFVDFIEDHRQEYPRSVAVQSEASSSTRATTVSTIFPTRGFVQSLANHTLDNNGPRPIVQVLDAETSYKDGAPGHERIKRTVASVIDGDGNRLCVHFATQITEAARSLTSGTLIRMDLFTATHYRVNDTSPLMPVVLVLRYTTVGSSPLVVSRTEISTPETVPFVPETDENEPPPVPSSDPSDDDGDIDPIPNRDAVCSWTHRLCSMYGLESRVCVCVSDPVSSFDLEVLAEN